MVSSIKFFIFTLFVSLFMSRFLSASSTTLQNPKSLIFPIAKDKHTLQYVTKMGMETPSVTKELVLDVSGRYLWIDCEKGYNSSSRKPGKCGSSICAITKPYGYGCTDCGRTVYKDCNNTCSLIPENTVTGRAWFEAVGVDTVSARILNGPKFKPMVDVPSFIFSCAQHYLLEGLARGAKGMACLGRTPISLPNQFSSAFGGSMSKKFAICLPSDEKSDGVLLLGDTKYVFYNTYFDKSDTFDVSARFIYTKLINNPVSTSMIFMDDEKSAEYYIGLKSILVNKVAIPINAELLTFDEFGFGGTMISTVVPYTIIESSMYNALVGAVLKDFASLNITRAAAVAPFSACFDLNSPSNSYSELGQFTPDIQFVMEDNAVWRMYGRDAMVEVSEDVVCLAFVEGMPRHIKPSIVIGGHQMQHNLIQFDLDSSRLGFTNTLKFPYIECNNFVQAA